MNFTVNDHWGREVEFLVSLHESAETFVYQVLSGPFDFMVETVANPTGKELVGEILAAYRNEVLLGHASRVREELDHGII